MIVLTSSGLVSITAQKGPTAPWCMVRANRPQDISSILPGAPITDTQATTGWRYAAIAPRVMVEKGLADCVRWAADLHHLPDAVSEQDRQLLAPWLQHDPVLFEAIGCEHCQGGYAGRLGVFQVLPISDPVQTLLFAQADRQALAAQAGRESVRTLRQSAWAKALQGLTSVREVLAHTSP